MSTLYTNNLIQESSLYLLQHAHNPVNWNPWSDDVLAQAKEENKLLIISIGYAACHWCHVMEKESFEDIEVAEVMNANFISIKVDREERPDIDDIYMSVCQLLNGQGGWPLNVVALPDGKPIWAGTYFNKVQWINILSQFKTYKSNAYNKLIEQANKITNHIQPTPLVQISEKTEFEISPIDSLVNDIMNMADLEEGGLAGAPKFPMPAIYEFLLSTYQVNNSSINSFLNLSLDKMCNGGIYDHIGGGFSRYSVDSFWFAPHFEKMLYDNAQLVNVYSRAYKITKNKKYKAVIEETISFVMKELNASENLFLSALDADSEGIEGLYYTWTSNDIDSLLGDEAPQFKELYNIEEGGNWEDGRNILYIKKTLSTITAEASQSDQLTVTALDSCKEKLLNERDRRPRPLTDDKSLASWNAMMISGLCKAYEALGNDKYCTIAVQKMDKLIELLIREDGGLWRCYHNKKSKINAFLDDYAFTLQALIDVYQISFDESYIKVAEQILDYCFQHFDDEHNIFFYYKSNLDKPLVTKTLEFVDNVIPSSNAVMAQVLLYMGHLINKQSYIVRSKSMLANKLEWLFKKGNVAFKSAWAKLYTLHAKGVQEVCILGEHADIMRKKLQAHHLPEAIFLGAVQDSSLEHLQNKFPTTKSLIYVCKNMSCSPPTESIDEALNYLNL